MQKFSQPCQRRGNFHSPKKKWTPEEDQLLMNAVKNFPDMKWSSLATQIPGRNGKQCRERWFYMLNPSNDNSPWTNEEDRLLFSLQKNSPNNWAKHATLLKGRSSMAIKNRWRWLKRHHFNPSFSENTDLQIAKAEKEDADDWSPKPLFRKATIELPHPPQLFIEKDLNYDSFSSGHNIKELLSIANMLN
ncbi:Myb-like DNA-binding domain containing protein [Trichomonas vaginalis G3]|uniref:Myb-like DNA-binding domain containing protein n=1 Tax=Trichomonas vaginalis (strain ATCC PRA-98 / G3) TaxID=412133 RepID=A2DZ31_TRIV3|nr:RNA polymerase II transcription regulator recruiting protein [Trichomonas vaginalis G3]EAY14307.1 Myb-like DNA-binding domain containing protein [Trichomonas vaginalis G3]KAI5517334.1 RNA polymerase II transcription regulator recruiting protein [Trichomonas vaginalis G3]|eukprot:XP_001326530.1 Myb-like DNA-binding domain containing protein [Trichomonas vaginalis G3]